MISRYLDEALNRARYLSMNDGGYCATVRGLRGVIAHGRTLEACRTNLAEVVEEWILVRVARGPHRAEARPGIDPRPSRRLMPPFGPISRRDLVRALRRLGFTGPFSGGKHEFMLRGDLVLTVPNPHRAEIGRDLLAIMLRQAGITRREWEGA